MRTPDISEFLDDMSVEQKNELLVQFERKAKLGRRMIWVVVLVIAMALTVIVLLLNGYHSKMASVAEDKQATQAQIKELRSEIQDMEREFAALVLDRIPNLTAIKENTKLEIAQGYVRSIEFTPLNRRGSGAWEYQIKLQNLSQRMVNPDLTISLFNRLGIELGSSELRAFQAPTLLPGDSSQHGGIIELNSNEPAKYFRIVTRS
ncbi:MAG: hypothetical protein KDH88_13000 [Chromatiales bacterium]|nr:hypothetical protein [Chromatiales bacterium]